MENLFYKDFISRLSKKAKQKNRLLSIDWAITYKCNLNCRHCYLPKEERKQNNVELKFSQIKSIADQLYEMGCLKILLTGGEIFAHKDSLQIIDYLKHKGFCLSLITNGTLINSQIAKSLSEINPPVEVFVSVYGLDEEINAQVVGIKGALAKTLKAIELLKQRGVSTSINMLIMRNNIKEIENVRLFARKHDLKFCYDFEVQPRLDGSKDMLRYRISALAAKDLIDRQESSLGRGNDCWHPDGARFSKYRLFYCSAGNTAMSINPYGKANVCLELSKPEFDILADGLSLCWANIVKFVKELTPSKDYSCHRCELADFCSWCPAMGWLYKRDLNRCVPFYRDLAKLFTDEFYAKK